jgi:hypothetical protein
LTACFVFVLPDFDDSMRNFGEMFPLTFCQGFSNSSNIPENDDRELACPPPAAKTFPGPGIRNLLQNELSPSMMSAEGFGIRGRKQIFHKYEQSAATQHIVHLTP